MVKCDDSINYFKVIDDISVKMKERALNDYGFVCILKNRIYQ